MGKLMPPRYGLLKYVLEACHATGARNIHIIPISISYDLIRDVEEYATNRPAAARARIPALVYRLHPQPRPPRGKVYMDVGKPVVLSQAPDPDDRLALSKIAFEVAVEVNHVTPSPSLAGDHEPAGAAPGHRQKPRWWKTGVLRNGPRRAPAHLSDFDRTYPEQAEGLLGIMIEEGIITRYDDGARGGGTAST